jgi:hypothetical protein
MPRASTPDSFAQVFGGRLRARRPARRGVNVNRVLSGPQRSVLKPVRQPGAGLGQPRSLAGAAARVHARARRDPGPDNGRRSGPSALPKAALGTSGPIDRGERIHRRSQCRWASIGGEPARSVTGRASQKGGQPATLMLRDRVAPDPVLRRRWTTTCRWTLALSLPEARHGPCRCRDVEGSLRVRCHHVLPVVRKASGARCQCRGALPVTAR